MPLVAREVGMERLIKSFMVFGMDAVGKIVRMSLILCVYLVGNAHLSKRKSRRKNCEACCAVLSGSHFEQYGRRSHSVVGAINLSVSANSRAMLDFKLTTKLPSLD